MIKLPQEHTTTVELSYDEGWNKLHNLEEALAFIRTVLLLAQLIVLLAILAKLP